VDFQLIHAVMESQRLASRFLAEGKVFATRMPDLQLRLSVIQTWAGWRSLHLAEGEKGAAKKKQAATPKKKAEG
jgi:hypothetical protein